jgi:signal transduction histidine kinase
VDAFSPSAPRWSETVLRCAALGMFAVSIALSVVALVLNSGIAGSAGLAEGHSSLDVGLVVVGAVLVLVGLLLSWVRPRNAVGWLLALSGLLDAACNAGQTYGVRALVVPHAGLPFGTYVLALSAPLWVPALFIPLSVLLARYPTGQLTGRWTRRFDRALIVGLAAFMAVYATLRRAVADEVTGYRNPLVIPTPIDVAIGVPAAVLAAVGLVGIVVSAVLRMRRARYPERQQLALFFTAALVAVIGVLAVPIQEVGTALFALIPVAVTLGVLRYGLLGLDVIVRRTLVYGVLTGLVLAVFVAVTTGLAGVMPNGVIPQLVAACVIAVGVVPARDRLQRAVDRIVYGDRRDPWAALHRLGAPTRSSTDEELMPAVLTAVADALRSPGAAVIGSGTSVSYGQLAGTPARVPLRFGGADLGDLAVAPRRGEHRLGKPDEHLLAAIAPLVAAVAYAERLAADLRTERARVLTATESERARLRQELHDGLGPSLTGVGLGLEAAQIRVAGDPQTTGLLTRVRSEVSAALDEIRRIIDDLRPAVFDELDLVTALHRRADQITGTGVLTVDFAAPPSIPPLAPACQTALYRIADEAITNAVRHAKATHCDVRLRINDDDAHLVIADNGTGIPHANGFGVGLSSMRQRAERLGGTFAIEDRAPGTAIVVDIPIGLPT